MKLILVRHGEAESNAKKLVGGSAEFPLTEKGIEQAQKLAKRFKDEKIDVVFCSSLSRARHTADEVLRFHPGVKVFYEDDLKEMSYGDLNGKPAEEFYAAVGPANYSTMDFKIKGGENFHEVFKRVKRVLDKAMVYKGKTVLLVAHGRIIRAIVSILLGMPIEDMMKIRFLNTSVTILELREGKFEKSEFNSVKHLEASD
jgi:broad specificity phosphatase PhoE